MTHFKDHKIKKAIAGAVITAIMILLIIVFAINKQKVKTRPYNPKSDLLSHPIYSEYRFNPADKVINIGVQPLYLPTGLISEAMARDAILQNALKDLDMEIEYYPFLKGDDINFFLQSKNLDIGIGGDMPAITAAAKMDIIVPVILQQGFASMVTTHPILVNQLRQKRIAYPFGSVAHYIALDLLASMNLSKSQVELIPMDVSGLAEALHQKKIDAFIVWEPISAIAIKTNPTFMINYQKMTSGYMYFSRTFYKKHPEAARQIMASTIRAFKWITANKQNMLTASKWTKEAGEKLWAQEIPLSINEISDLAKKDIFGLSSIPFFNHDELSYNGPLHKKVKFLNTLGVIQPVAIWERIRNSFDPVILKEISTKPSQYGLDRFDYHTGPEYGGGK
jgi:sulfonate transport system substrate-binding protein